MMRLFFLFLFFCETTFAFTLNNNFGASFKDHHINVTIAGNTSCAQVGLTVYELEDLIAPAIDRFWNQVPTSSLRLHSNGFTQPLTNINSGRLCAPTDDACITAAGPNVIAPVSDIVIACNDNALNFGSSSVLAVTVPNQFSGKKITGAVILINNSSTIFSTLNRDDQIGVIAHEIGHAIGLGHTDDSAALMYYRTVKQRKSLGEDDMRGVSYLYPMKVDGYGLLGGCGTIKTNSSHGQGGMPLAQIFGPLVLMILMMELYRLFCRHKARLTLKALYLILFK